MKQPPQPKAPYTARNVVGLIGKLVRAEHAHLRLCDELVYTGRAEAFAEVIAAENQLVEALEEVLKS